MFPTGNQCPHGLGRVDIGASTLFFPGLSEQDHECGDVNEGEEVLGFFLVAGGDSAVMLDLRPETFDQVSVFVSRPIGLSWRLRVRPAGHHGLATLSFDGLHDCLRIVPFVGDDDFQRQTFDQRLRLRHVGRLPRSQDQPDRQPQPVHDGVDFGSESASTATQRWVGLTTGAVRFFWAPAAQGWARITVESRISHSTSGSGHLQTPPARSPFATSGRTASTPSSSGRTARANRATGHPFEPPTGPRRKTVGCPRSHALVPQPE